MPKAKLKATRSTSGVYIITNTQKDETEKGGNCMFAKKNWKKGVVVAGAFACMAAFSLFGKMEANAATAPADLKQTSDSTGSVEVEWNGALDDKKYYVEISEDQQNWLEKRNLSSTFKSTYISGLNAGSTYYVRVKTEATDGTTAYSEVIDVVTCPNTNVTEFIQEDATTNSVTLSWNPVENANMYEIDYYDTSKAAYVTEAATDATSYKKSGLDASFIKEEFRIRACRKSKAGYVADTGNKFLYGVRTVPGKVTSIKKNYWTRSKSSSSLKLDWKESNGVKGYQVKVYNTKNKCIETYTANYNWIYINDLSGKSCATVKIRAYIQVNGKTKYSAWSSKKNIVPEVYGKYNVKDGLISVSWQKVTGATGYDIYVKTDVNGTYKKVGSVSGSKKTFKIKKFKGKKIKRTQSYYVSVVAKQKVGSKTYKSSSN